MSPHQTIAVGVRLFAIWLAIYVARLLPSYYQEAAKANDSTFTAVIVVGTVLTVLFILLLWFFPKSVARGLLDTENVIPGGSPSPDMWLAVGCALIGIWLIVPAITSLIYELSVLYEAQRNPALDTTSFRISWIYYVAEIAFGVWLLLGARGVRKLFWWARGAGQ